MSVAKKTLSLREYPNPKFIKNIFTHPDIYPTQRNSLKKYCNSFNGESITIEYIKHNRYGRYFLKDSNSLSCTAMWNKIRSTLFEDSDLDIDIVNAHNELLLTLLDPNIYDIDNLKYYCENRQEVIDSIDINEEAINKYNLKNTDNKTKKDMVKLLFTILLYGGSLNTWTKSLELEECDYTLPDFVKNYIQEIAINSNIIINDKRFKDIVTSGREFKIEKAKKKYGKNFDIEKFKIHSGKILCIILQEYETLLVDKAMEFMTKKECIITSYNYDGFQIKKIDNIDEVINELNNYINTISISHNKTLSFNFDRIKFIVKPFKEGLDTSKLLVLDSEHYERKHMNSTTDYSLQKEYFEKFHLKLLEPFCYVKITGDHTQFIKPHLLTGMYNEIKSEDDKFITKWLNDNENRTYERCDYYPIDSKCPKNHLNLWLPYPILDVVLDEKADTSIIYNHFNILFKNEKIVIDYVLDWFAHIVQKPDRKTMVCLLLYGKQRTGKSTIGEYILRRIIGLTKMLITSKTDKVFGRFANTQGKLLVVLNEANGAETFNITDILKDAITCNSTEQEKKGIDGATVTDYCNYIFTTNNLNSVKVSEDDSRFFAVEVSDELKGNVEYFNELYKALDDDLIMRKLYQELLERDISKFSPSHDRPTTELYEDMKELNRDPIEHFIEYWRMILAGSEDKEDNDVFMSKTMKACDLYREFRNFWKEQGKSSESIPTLCKFGIRLKQFKNDIEYKKRKGIINYSLI